MAKLRYNIDIQSEIDYLLEGFADGLTNRSRLQGNPERKHGRNQPEHARRNASVGGGNAFRRGTSHQKEVRPFGKLPEQERSGEQRPPQHRRFLH